MGGVTRGATERFEALGRSSLAARIFVVGTLLSSGVWAVAISRFSSELATVEERVELITTRYARAQDALSSLRMAAVQADYARQFPQFPQSDLAPDPEMVLAAALREYRPIWDLPSERAIIDRLQHEVETARPASLVAVSDELQSLNRVMFLSQQSELGAASRKAEARLQRGLNVALVLSLVVCFTAAVYATRLESRLERQRADERRYVSDLQRLSARVVAVQEDERRSIARDLHDEVGQALAAIKVELAVVDTAAGGARGAEALARARAIADDTVRNVRDLSHLLHPPLLEELGLVHALEHQVKEFSRRHGVSADFTADFSANDASVRLPGAMEQAIYRIVQEALTNVAKHAHARSCHVSLARNADAVTVTVVDDGVGLPVSVPRGPGALLPGNGLGLVGIRERASCFRGSVDVSSGRDGVGVSVSVVLPVGEEVRDGRDQGTAWG